VLQKQLCSTRSAQSRGHFLPAADASTKLVEIAKIVPSLSSTAGRWAASLKTRCRLAAGAPALVSATPCQKASPTSQSTGPPSGTSMNWMAPFALENNIEMVNVGRNGADRMRDGRKHQCRHSPP